MKKPMTLCIILLLMCMNSCKQTEAGVSDGALIALKDGILERASRNLNEKPITVTHAISTRSTGGIHDFFSEGDYWWPDPDNPGGPYIRKDGQSNPENFGDHRKALMRFSEVVGNLCSAFLITNDTGYVNHIKAHCDAWFAVDSSKMNPHLLYAQAIHGRHTGRAIGIIDGIHLMEVVQSLIVLEQRGLLEGVRLNSYKAWFSSFLNWMTTHPYGLKEMVHPNNHSTCWNMQVGLYADFTGNDSIFHACVERFTHILLPSQMAPDGSFPLELARTKPYGYSLFNLDAMAGNALVLSTDSLNLWNYQADSGQSIQKGIVFMAPFVKNKGSWTWQKDIMYWENWPVAQPAFIFGAKAYGRPDFFRLWEVYEHFPEVFEVKRNLPIRNPLIWMERLNSI
ncbi:MAG: alginate lyase family protein [Bacteroidia bacterium]|nr:alginate lyase family protein [Bacteroidia bacterium]